MADETTTAPAPSAFVDQMKAWQNGEPAPTAGVPAPSDSPAPAAPVSPPDGSTLGSPTAPADEQPPAAPAPADSGAPRPDETPPPGDAKVDQRVSDAQRKMHEATARATAAEAKVAAMLGTNTVLREQLAAVSNAHELQPLTADAFDFTEAVTGIIADYKKPADQGGPKDDDEALALLVTRMLDLGDQRTRTARRLEENARREATRHALTRQAVETFITQVDPTFPLPLFWTMLPAAEAETPAEIRRQADPGALHDWQARRALAKCYEILDGRAERIRETTLHSERTERAAGVVMPGGGSVAPVAPKVQPRRPLTMVEQIDQLQGRTVPPA